MFKQYTAHKFLHKFLLVLSLVAGLAFISATATAQAATDPSCDYVVTGSIDKRHIWNSGSVVCYNLEFEEYAQVFVIAVKALDSGGKYDVYLSPGWLGTGQKLDTKINRKPIKKAHKTVRMTFTYDTLDLNQLYTVALVPRSGYVAGSRAAVRFSTDQVWGATRPQTNNGGGLTSIPSQLPLDVKVAGNGLEWHPLVISCPGTVNVSFSASILDANDPDPRVTVRLFAPGDDKAWEATEANYYDNLAYRATEAHIRKGKVWHLEFKNRGNKPIAVKGMARMPEDSCAPIAVTKTATFQYSGTAGEAFDVTLEQAHRDQNFVKNSRCYVDGDDNGGYERNTLLFWDVSSIPYGSKVTKATVQLTVFNESADRYYVYDVKRNWHPYMATWDEAADNRPWSRGGATGSSDLGGVVGTLNAFNTGTATINLDPAVVQKWVNGHVVDNEGLLIANSQADDGIDFYCMESTSQSRRPKLIVEYEI